jgi:hypothetical protein
MSFDSGGEMPRKPVSVEVVQEGDERYVLLTYANGDVAKRAVQSGLRPRRRPRRPQTRLKLAREDEGKS